MKKLLSIFMCIILLIEAFSMISFAVPVELAPYSKEVLQFPEDIPEDVDNSGQPIRFFSNPRGSYLFGDMLTQVQKAVYDCILENQAGLLTDGSFTLVFPVTDESIGLTVEAAVASIIDDYPEYFWVGAYGWSGGYTQNSTYYLDFYFALNTSNYEDWDAVRQSYYSMLEAIENVSINSGTRYDKVKAIHDYICLITTYQSTAMAHEPTGVFLNGQAVCEGYSEAFKLLCDREKIPCITVVGTGNGGAHEWNYVQMEDGKWYGVDATWDDQEDKIFYDYFLVGSTSVTSGCFGNALFGDGSDSSTTGGDHVNVGTHFQNSQYALTYPTLSANSYSLLVPFIGAVATYDSIRNLMFIPKNAILSQQLFCTCTGYTNYAPSNNSASISGNTTGATLTVISPVSKIFKVVRKGDINADNSVSQNDISLVKMYLSGDENAIEEINSSTEKFNAADLNQDGVIDGFDLYYINKYVYTDRLINE